MTSPLLRSLGIALLLLAVSPITAPFATCDLNQLLGQPVPSSGPAVQAKTAPDEPVSDLGADLDLQFHRDYSSSRVAAGLRAPLTRSASLDQLRL